VIYCKFSILKAKYLPNSNLLIINDKDKELSPTLGHIVVLHGQIARISG